MTATTTARRPDLPVTRRLYEIEVLRILTFASVVGVHVTSHTVKGEDYGLYGLLTLLHYTREVFFWLTGFLLALSFLARPQPLRRFWPRRFLLVGVPYVAWSAIYFLGSNIQRGDLGWSDVPTLLVRIATGSAWYHLYFLLVTMQIYLLHPLIQWLVRKTAGHHVALLAVLGVYQLALMWLYQYARPALGWLGASSNQKLFFFSYLFFIVGGAVSAWHARPFLDWVRRHRPLIAVLTAGAAVLTLAVWLGTHFLLGMNIYRAGTPLQPVIGVWAAALVLAFLAVGTWWADRRRPDGWGTRVVDRASDRSFGIFLAHPFVLWLLLLIGDGWIARVVPTPWLTLVVYVVVVFGAFGITELARRTPASLPLTGRPFRAGMKSG